MEQDEPLCYEKMSLMELYSFIKDRDLVVIDSMRSVNLPDGNALYVVEHAKSLDILFEALHSLFPKRVSRV